MEKLLASYSIGEIIIFIVLLALAIKGLVTFYDWARDRLKKVYDKEYKHEQEKQNIAENSISIEELHRVIEQLNKKVDVLTESDKDDIKSFLTKEHHYFCYQKGWIDDYSLECCLNRYKHYKDEGGNSFIEGFMKELQALPKKPS